MFECDPENWVEYTKSRLVWYKLAGKNKQKSECFHLFSDKQNGLRGRPILLSLV